MKVSSSLGLKSLSHAGARAPQPGPGPRPRPSLVLPEGLGTEKATGAHKLVFGAIAAVMTLVFLLVLPQAAVPAVPIPGFIPAFIAIVIVTDLITTYLLFVHAPLARRADLLWLAAAYLFSASVASAQFLVFPNVVSPKGLFGAGPQSAIWLWVFWHAGFPAFICAALLRRWRTAHGPGWGQPTRRNGIVLAALILLLTVLLTILVTRFQGLLPSLIVGKAYANLAETPIGQAVLLLNLCAAGLVLFVTRGRSLIDLGLCITVLAATFDVALTLHAGARYSVGWYLGRCFSVGCALPILGIYLTELTWLYARVTGLNTELAKQARIDVTTGLFNRRYFNVTLAAALAEAATRQQTLALLLVDVDHFKRYNDREGHLAGDHCLHAVAQAISATVPQAGAFAARYGGEEFAVVLPNADSAVATARAEAVLATIRALALAHPDSPTAPHVTVSVGIALAWPGASFADLVNAADASLYAAKRDGRNGIGPAQAATQRVAPTVIE